MIDDVNSSGGGKTVNVVMRAPYPAWRELFTDILPVPPDQGHSRRFQHRPE